MPNIMYAALHALDTPGRFEGALIVDTRFQHHASWTPNVLTQLFEGRYIHVPAWGSQSCTDGSADPTPQIVSWSEGLAQVQAAYTPGQAVIVLCGCPEVDDRSHRKLIAHEAARELALEEGGALP